FHNAFTKIYEARFVGGVVAGLKLNELVAEGKLTDKNYNDGKIKLGYVGAYPYAEVVSGYTGFYLGVKSVCPDVVMDVQYTNSWFDPTGESEAATKMLSDGCVIISQHADSTGAPSAVEEYHNAGNVCYCVGYNIDMTSVAPNSALTSAKNNWKNYYSYLIKQVKNGVEFPTDWAEGYEDDSVGITKLGKACAAGTDEKVKEVEAKLKSGELKVFSIDNFTVNGEKVTHAFATDSDGDFVNDCDEAIMDGYYNESFFQSAPSFSLRIDGITELNNG
ncbi:MAG: BMP family ABC transporter substrate-binding protein, partial [Lachnospiraceae bacterium]|nr:BMP family ABC transporter substrate-binding protein [Lachnospiraceae bacterium]